VRDLKRLIEIVKIREVFKYSREYSKRGAGLFPYNKSNITLITPGKRWLEGLHAVAGFPTKVGAESC
jgi:hypothetical protein